jgi:hypothetical protein
MTRFNLLRRTALVAALACAGSISFAQSAIKLTLGHGNSPTPSRPRPTAALRSRWRTLRSSVTTLPW